MADEVAEKKRIEREAKEKIDLIAQIEFALQTCTIERMTACCYLCLGFVQRQKDRLGFSISGECHRYAPRPNDLVDAAWPRVLSSQGCMEYVEDEKKVKALKTIRVDIEKKLKLLKPEPVADTAAENPPGEAAETEKGGKKGKW